MTDPCVYPAPRNGCTFEVAHRKPCNSQDTVQVDGVVGRRCADHPSTFDPHHAVALMVSGQPWAALAYVRWSP